LTARVDTERIDDALVAPQRAAAAGWDARLVLGFERIATRSVLTHREHRGPLVVQKPLYPEGPDVCQCVIVHPPAGIVGGDRLVLDVCVARGAKVQLTTPAATRWYRSAGAPASQRVLARVDDGALLEWLPQGMIVQDGARAQSSARVDLAGAATFIGMELVGLGRRAAGERFRCGEWRQRFEIVRNAAPIWSERAVVKGDSALLASAAGLNGASVFGTFVAVGATLDDAMISGLRGVVALRGNGGVTRLPDLLVARYLGDSMEAASAYFLALWSRVRPALTGSAAVPPRIWST
jgi:urease accessory protein